MIKFGRPGKSKPGDTAYEGTSGAHARSDHRHEREDAPEEFVLTYGLPTDSAPGDVAAEGTGTAVARATHRHGREDETAAIPSVIPVFVHDRFPDPTNPYGSTPSTEALSYVPLINSLHLYKNRNTVLDEGNDYSLSGNVITYLAGSVVAGDFVNARYVYNAGTSGPAGAGYVGTPPSHAAIVQTADISWVGGTQGSAKTATFPNPVTPGNLVVIAFGFLDDGPDHVSGCGVNPWNSIISFPTTNPNYTTVIAYTVATAAGTSVTVNVNPGFTVGGGAGRAYEVSGVSRLLASGTMNARVVSTAQTSPALAATAAGQFYIGVTATRTGTASTGIVETPGAFTDTHDTATPTGGGGTNGVVYVGARVTTAVETDQREIDHGSLTDGISAAALFRL